MAVSLVFMVCFVSSVVSQAPGDGDSFCVDELVNGSRNPYFDLRPTYPANVRPLMDSRDYVGLLQGSDNLPWQQVDNDDNNTAQVATEWSQPIFNPCEGTVTVCGFSEGAQENWLITQHISRELEDGQRLQKVTAQFQFTLNGCDMSRQCRQSFVVYKWQTSTIDREAARNTDNYDRVGLISTEVTDGNVRATESLTIELSAERGFYLAVVDLSTCISIHRILVFYYVCPAETSELIIRPVAIHVPDSSESALVSGECVQNSSPQNGLNPVLRCGDKGQWQVVIPCHCNPGYELDNLLLCSECDVGNYSEVVSNMPCEPCPSNSEATQTGLRECSCVQNYYRAADERPSVACTQSPSAPVNVSVSDVTNTSVQLSWLPPEDDGGRDLSEIYYTITARVTNGGGATVFVTEINGTETNVTGLTPGAYYSFSVTAENAVSSQDKNATIRSAKVTATMEEGAGEVMQNFFANPVAGVVSDISVSDTVVSWSPPDPPNGVILYYNINITNADSGDLVILIEELNTTSIDVAKYGETGGEYIIEVQAVTRVGAGNFSETVLVVMGQSSESSSSSPVVPVTVAVIVVVIVVLSAIAAVLLVYIFWYRSHVKSKSFYHGIELPSAGHRMYVDPTTYTRVDQAVQEFAAEIPLKSIRLTEEIGNGEFGNVYCGIWRTEEKEQLSIAVKTLKPGSSHKLRDNFLTEASIMGQFNHPNVIKLYGVATRVEPVMIVMEYMEKGSLYYYLRKHDEQFNSIQLVKMALGVAKGMEYLSGIGFVHRDLAARNVLVDRDETTKVADFGLSRETVEEVYEVTKGGKIPVRWTAPEAIAYRKFTTSSDVWSFGVLLWEVMSYCQQPYEDWDNQTVLTKLDAGHRLPIPKDCPDTVYNCMLECWNGDRKRRPSFVQVVKILEILLEGNNISDGPRPKPRTKNPQSIVREVPSPLDHETVRAWLQSIKMDRYTDHFQEAGHTSVQSCLNLNADELSRMGITLAGHQNKIISSIRIGRDQLDRQNSVRI